MPATAEYGPPQRSLTPSRNPIELDAVFASEVDEWRTSANMRHRQTNNVLDDVRCSCPSDLPVDINTPQENSQRGRVPPLISHHACRKEPPAHPQAPSKRGHFHPSLITHFLPSGVAPCVLCYRRRLYCIISQCHAPGTKCDASF